LDIRPVLAKGVAWILCTCTFLQFWSHCWGILLFHCFIILCLPVKHCHTKPSRGGW